MSILVENVTKVYGHQKALNQVKFQVGKAEIVGFLGPNGAGKSTMMKIITGFIPPQSGKISVCGFSVLENPFVAQIHKVKEVEKRVNEMIQLVGLGSEAHKKIHQLSKGYKQRVGLAQSIIHDPEVLILDEPTSGLDPNQIKEIRDVIVNIGKHKTVLLSTHIMQEVEAMCSRVIIIRKGEIVADGAIEEFTKSGKKLEDVFSELTK